MKIKRVLMIVMTICCLLTACQGEEKSDCFSLLQEYCSWFVENTMFVDVTQDGSYPVIMEYLDNGGLEKLEQGMDIWIKRFDEFEKRYPDNQEISEAITSYKSLINDEHRKKINNLVPYLAQYRAGLLELPDEDRIDFSITTATIDISRDTCKGIIKMKDYDDRTIYQP